MEKRMFGGGRALGVVLALAVASLPVTSSLAEEDELARLRAEIEAEGLGWTAGETPVSRLPREVFRSMLLPVGVDRVAEMAAHFDGDPSPLSTVPPPPPWVPRPSPDAPVFTWRNVEGEDWTTPVRNQGLCGACTIFAAVAVIEGAANVAYGSPDLDLYLAEQNLLSCTSVSCSGGGLDAAVGLNRAQNHGVPDEGCHPYTATDGNCGDACADLADRVIKVSQWGWAAGPNFSDFMKKPTEEQIKEALTHGPLSTSMTVYSDFASYTGGVYRRTSAATQEGGHAVTIIGWNDQNDSWYGKNSWGPFWGNNGYFEIERGQVGFAEEGTAWAHVDVSLIPGVMTVSPETISANLELGSGGTATGTVEVQFEGDEGEMDIFVDAGGLPGWLWVSPTTGTIGPGQSLEIEFEFDEGGWPLDGSGYRNHIVGIVAGHGMGRTVDARLSVIAPAEPDPEPDPEPDDEEDEGADEAEVGAGDSSCGCASAGATRSRLLAHLWALVAPVL